MLYAPLAGESDCAPVVIPCNLRAGKDYKKNNNNPRLENYAGATPIDDWRCRRSLRYVASKGNKQKWNNKNHEPK